MTSGMCNLNPLPCLLDTKDNSVSSLRLSANRCKSFGFPPFMGLTWDLEDVLHVGETGRCRCASFVVQKGEASSMMARVVEKGFMEDKSGTLNDGWFA